MKNIVIYGMRGVGKTTIGKLLSQKIGIKFYDLDKAIEDDIGGPIFEFVEKKGWDAFREKEHENLEKLLNIDEDKVISLGGGAIIFENNQDILLKKSDKLIYIDCPLETIYNRIKVDEEMGNKRNSLTEKGLLEELQEVYMERKNDYESFYDFKVENIYTEDICIQQIIKKINYARVCVSISNFQIEKLKEQIDKINTTREIKIVELRIDYMENENISKILPLLKNIKKQIIITNRSQLEGGNFSGNFEEGIEKIGKFSKTMDYVDIELIAGKEIYNLQNKLPNKKIILSYHNFQETPNLDFLINKIDQMHLFKADIFKIAVMPKSKEDVEIIYQLQEFFQKNYSGKDFIFISMGELGAETRIKLAKKGATLTFGVLDKASAPGQIDYSKTYKLIYMEE